ncbi:MAG TPA: hypothetical protein VJR06_07950 [Nitrososphaerales archaeon]|nr:hypothetical protein [Nitrososphaerales archaeon]
MSVALDSTRDYILKLGHITGPGGITVVGGHNVLINGGQVMPVVDSTQADGYAMRFYDQTGTVHVEGVYIDNAGDGILIRAPKATFQLENIRVGNLHAYCDNFSLNHPDVIQTWSGPAEMRIDRLTGETDYQGFLWARASSSYSYPGRVIQKNVNLKPSPLQSCGASLSTFHNLTWHVSSGTYFSCSNCWALTGWYSTSYRRKLQDSIGGYDNGNGTYTDPYYSVVGFDGQVIHDQESWNDIGRRQGDYMSWPTVGNLVNERWYWGSPSGGDFAPAGLAGTSYVSPGYG